MKKSIVLVSVVLLFTTCAEKERFSDTTPREKIGIGDTVYLDSGIKYVFAKMSEEGEFVTSSNFVTTHINLYIGENRIWSTYEPLQPFSFVLDQVPMIDGFKEVIKYMRTGDRLTAIIPPHLGYGSRGNGPDIPPGSTLNFDIAVLDVETLE